MLKYRISQTVDPEERLEDAAMAKAMHDAFCGRLEIVSEGEADFGRDRWFSGDRKGGIAYWRDQAFLDSAARDVRLMTPDEANKAVGAYHAAGRGAFVKATNLKLFAIPVPVGTGFYDAVGDYIYSVIDRGPCIMVQPLCIMKWEMRFVSVGRKIVTESPVAWHLTPISRLDPWMLFETPRSITPSAEHGVLNKLCHLARSVAAACEPENVIIDCAMIDGHPGVIEFNPFSIGNFGLYACDPRKIAEAVAAIHATEATHD